MSYIGNSPGVASQRVVTTFTATANQTTFTPQSGYTLGYIDVYDNGVRLVNGDDYTASNGTNVVLATGAAAGDVVETVAYIPRGLSDGYTKAEADTLLAAKQNSLGYTPVNKAGDTMMGPLGVRKVNNDNDTSVAASFTRANDTGGIRVFPSLGGGQFNNAVNASDCGVISGSQFGAITIASHDGASIRLSQNAIQIRGQNSASAADISVDSAGRVTMPFQPAFSASGGNQGNEAKSPGSYYIFGTEYVNRGGQYNSSTGLYTAPVAGVYFFASTVYLNSGGQICFYINGTAWGGSDVEGMVYSQTSVNTGTMTMMVNLAAGDYVGVSTRPGFSATTLYMGHSNFSGHLVG